ncbi:PIG-P-domain-containing protein [Anaeromyces robustus]|uniref:PIG-P-domain-containing protein n=1 Tax=Anaeromyces robustus TaxID=1754192 RepID=A0A1Y1VUJ7_9FUNG|nr:PIG-P-domain-containing protein [Anaeromyces robustus]|eukprot:ORX64968.1 PIG-P-domain-containing protein [Anaeromyces robustus]
MDQFIKIPSTFNFYSTSQKEFLSNSINNAHIELNKNINLSSSELTNNVKNINDNSKKNLINNFFQNKTYSEMTYEFYGFAFYLISFLAFILWLIWAFTTKSTDSYLKEHFGFTYFPKRYWAVVIPNYIIMCILFYVVIFLCYNFIHTPSFNSLNTITDKYSILMKNAKYIRLENDEDIPELQDIPISVVNAYLYSDSFNDSNKY